jgi:hypothetical protein
VNITRGNRKNAEAERTDSAGGVTAPMPCKAPGDDGNLVAARSQGAFHRLPGVASTGRPLTGDGRTELPAESKLVVFSSRPSRKRPCGRLQSGRPIHRRNHREH